MRIEQLIISQLIHNEQYARKVLPYFKSEYFEDQSERLVFKTIEQFVNKHNTTPPIESLLVELEQHTNISEEVYKSSVDIVNSSDNKEQNADWLLEQSEKFCQDRAIYLAIMESINVLDGNKTNLQKGAIPSLLSDALSVSFDPSVGHDYLEDVEQRYDFYHTVEDRIEFDLDMMNKITKGGLPTKTLNIVLAGTGVGKSLFMCHCAASSLSIGKNVLYITLEMAEERIAERIDANLLDVPVDQLTELSKDMYIKKVDKVKKKTIGKIIIKEYPTASASSNHFKNLLSELKIKRNFEPDIIFIDYLNICQSARLKGGANVNSYTYVKAIAEELRGLAVEYNVPIVSATQTTRSGYTSTDLGLEDTSESFGLPATADLMFALISTEELEDLNQILVKQLKNRYNDPTQNKRFIIGVDRSKMRLYDVEQSAQKDLVDAGQDDEPVFDVSTKGRMKNKKDFSDIVF